MSDDNKKTLEYKVSFRPPSQHPTPSLSSIAQSLIRGGKKNAFFFTLSAIRKLKMRQAFFAGTLIHYYMKSRHHKN